MKNGSHCTDGGMDVELDNSEYLYSSLDNALDYIKEENNNAKKGNKLIYKMYDCMKVCRNQQELDEQYDDLYQCIKKEQEKEDKKKRVIDLIKNELLKELGKYENEYYRNEMVPDMSKECLNELVDIMIRK